MRPVCIVGMGETAMAASRAAPRWGSRPRPRAWRLSFWGKAFDDSLPYVVAMVELEEGVRMLSTVVGYAPEEVRIGMPVAVTFDPVTPEVTLPRFRPV